MTYVVMTITKQDPTVFSFKILIVPPAVPLPIPARPLANWVGAYV